MGDCEVTAKEKLGKLKGGNGVLRSKALVALQYIGPLEVIDLIKTFGSKPLLLLTYLYGTKNPSFCSYPSFSLLDLALVMLHKRMIVLEPYGI